MKQLFLLTLLLCCYSLSIAQSKYFETSLAWDIPNTINGFKIIEQPNKKYIIGGSVFNDSTNPMWVTYSAVADQWGDLLYHYTNFLDTTLFNGCSMRSMLSTEYGYIMSGFINDTDSPLSSIYLVRIDTMGLLIDQTVLAPPNLNNYTNIGYSICRTPDGGYLLGGSSGTQSWSSPYLCKLGSDLNIEWDTLYEQYTNEYSKMLQIKPSRDGTAYWAIANINTTDDEGDIGLLKIDDIGTIAEEHVYGQPDKKELTWKFIETMDNNFAFVVTRLTNQGSYMGGMVKTNNLNNIAWSNLNVIRTIDGGVLQLRDSTFIISGSSFKDYPPNDLDTQISKFSHDGQLLWTRHYGNEGNDYVYDMILDSEGSLVFCGRDEAINQPNVINGANLYLLKTNCMGLLTEPQAAFSSTVDMEPYFAAFQNLSQFVYPDSTDGGHYVWEFGDGTAPQIDNAAFVSHTFPAYGTYTVRLTAVVCSDTSVVEQEVGVFPVGLPQMEMGGFSVYPNPAQDHLVVQNHNQEQSATFILYDVLGRQVLSFTSNNQSIVSVEHLPSGVYLYQFINPQNQMLTYGKVSVVR